MGSEYCNQSYTCHGLNRSCNISSARFQIDARVRALRMSILSRRHDKDVFQPTIVEVVMMSVLCLSLGFWMVRAKIWLLMHG